MNVASAARDTKNTYLRLLFALLAAFGALLVAKYVYLGEFLTTDENSYLFQAWLFSNGEYRTDIPFPALKHVFTHRMIILDQEAGWLSRYPPAHAAWLVPGLKAGYPGLMVAVAAFCSLWFTMKAGERLGIPVWIIALTMLVSPYFWLMQGSVLSHTSGLAAIALMTWAFIVWTQENNSKYAAIAGLAWAFLFLNRTYTAVWIALPFAVYAITLLVQSRSYKTLIGTSVFAACSSIGVVSFLAYNYLVTGDPLVSTFLYYEPSDGPGFGSHHRGINHTFERGWEQMKSNIATLNVRLWGFPGSLVACLILVFIGWRKGITPLLFSCTLLVWGAYIAFWFPGITQLAPVYYYETFIFITLGTGLGINRLVYTEFWKSLLLRNSILSLALVLVFVFAIDNFRSKAKIITDRSAFKLGFQQAIQNVPSGSIVLLSHVPKDILDESSWNPHGLESDPLIIRELWGISNLIPTLFPGRPVYSVRGNRAQAAELIDIIPNEKLIIPAISMRRNTGDIINGDHLAAIQTLHAPGWLGKGHKQYLAAGLYQITFYLETSETNDDVVGTIDVYKHANNAIIAKRDLRKIEQKISVEIELTELSIIEPRVFYKGNGKLNFYQIEISPLD